MTRKESPPSSPLNARAVALALLTRVIEKAQPLEQAQEQIPDFLALEARDRAFVQLLCKTVLRNRGQIDALLQEWMARALPDNARVVQNILRLGLAQLLWLQTPPHAAVHATVELVKDNRAPHCVGLVNAVLQRAVREGNKQLAEQYAPKINTPEWLWKSWVEAYGEAITEQIAEAHVGEPPLDITVKNDAKIYADILGGEIMPTGSVRLHKPGNIRELAGFTEGAWWVQDAAASLPAQLLGDVRGKRVIDLCAAPGGKTAQLAAAGAKVTSVDISENRLRTLKANLERLQLQADTVTADALKWQPDFTPDAILLDAPCSATGTIRRHPDVAWHRTVEDVERLRITQAKLLRRALEWLPKGGKLIYAVCSLQASEGESQIETILQELGGKIQLFDLSQHIRNIPLLYSSSYGIRTLPCDLREKGGMDGFFMSGLEKK